MNVISFSQEDRDLRNCIKELSESLISLTCRYDNCTAERNAENASKSQIYEKPSGLGAFSKPVLTIVRPESQARPSHQKVERCPLFGQYNLCRAFQPGSYQRHININLLERSAKNGIMVHRPRHPIQVDPTSSIIQIKRAFSMLRTKGNKGIISNKGDLSNLSTPVLSRSLPSEEDLGTVKIISASIEPKRGPGRPYGKYTPKKQSSAKASSVRNGKNQNSQGADPLRESRKHDLWNEHEHT